MRFLFGVAAVFFLLAGMLFLLRAPRVISLEPNVRAAVSSRSEATSTGAPTATILEATGTIPAIVTSVHKSVVDLPNQAPLANPPATAKGVYVTGWSAGSASKIGALLELAAHTGINAMVIDIKDYSGLVSYTMAVPGVKENRADREIRIVKPNALLAELHQHNIYVIGRITVFQDPILAKAHPEWALRNKTTGAVWTDHKGLSWMDPAAQPVWDYNTAIAQDALRRGFDEINFDYIRFASDGDLANISFPVWDGKTSKAKVIKNFFAYLRKNLSGAKISADLFGLATVNHDDLGIGQVIENAYPYFDYVSPMVYPSHYATGFLGFKNPANHPYEIIQYSMASAARRLLAAEKATTTASSTPSAEPMAKLRPWIQVFDLGARYDGTMIQKELTAVTDVFLHSSSTPQTAAEYGGWLMWDPRNDYFDVKSMQL